MKAIEILKKQAEKLEFQAEKLTNELEKIANEKAFSLSISLSEYFKDFTITVRRDCIRFMRPTKIWSDFEIYRRYDWGKETYGVLKFEVKSMSDASEEVYKNIICSGVLAKEALNNTDAWKEYEAIMNELSSEIKSKIHPIQDDQYEIQMTIKTLEKQEIEQKINELFNKGKVELKDERRVAMKLKGNHSFYSDNFSFKYNKESDSYTISTIKNGEETEVYCAKKIKKEDILNAISSILEFVK